MLRTVTHRFRATNIVYNSIAMQGGRGRQAARGRSGRGGRSRRQQQMSSTTSSSGDNTSNKNGTGSTNWWRQNQKLGRGVGSHSRSNIARGGTSNQQTNHKPINIETTNFHNQSFITNYVELPSIKSMHHNVHVPRLLSYVNVMRIHRLKSKLLMRVQ